MNVNNSIIFKIKLEPHFSKGLSLKYDFVLDHDARYQKSVALVPKFVRFGEDNDTYHLF